MMILKGRKTLATRSANDLVEHIKTGGTVIQTLKSKNNDSISFYVPVTWTPGWYSYYPNAQINIDKKDVEIRISKYKGAKPTNYEKSHIPPYYRVSPSVSWANGIDLYKVDMKYELVLIDTIIGGVERYNIIKGECESVVDHIPDECIE